MISKYSARLVAKSVGARVSDDAVLELSSFLEKMALKIAQEAVDISVYAGRRTVMKKDVEFAARKLFRGLL